MRIAAQKINGRGIDVSRTKVRLTTEKYVKQCGQMCERLYDMGYLPSPLVYDEDAFFGCFFEEYPKLMTLCRNVTTGSINLSDKQLSYVLKVIGREHDAYEALSTAVSAAQATQALNDINEFLSKVRFQKKSDVLTCRSSLAVSSKVYSSGKISLDSPYLRECFYLPAGKHIEEVNYSIVMLRTVLHNIGVDDSVNFGDPSVLLGDGFTVADDCEFLSLILSGDIEGSGKYASRVHIAVEKYYSDYYRTRTTIAECIKYEEQVFLDSIPSAIALVNEFREVNPGVEEFFVDSKRVYFSKSGVEQKSANAVRDIFIGEDISNIGATSVSLMNRLLGYSGQFLYKFDGNVMDYDVVGMPVVLYVVDKHSGQRSPVDYYPASSLRRRYQTMSLPVVGTGEYNRQIWSVEDVLKELDIETLDTLDSEVAELVEVTYKTHSAEFKALVGMLVQTLVCTLCDYTPSGRKSPNHVSLGAEYSWVTDEIYLDACAVAETFYEKLGF